MDPVRDLKEKTKTRHTTSITAMTNNEVIVHVHASWDA